jgi:hypothetical protein
MLAQPGMAKPGARFITVIAIPPYTKALLEI